MLDHISILSWCHTGAWLPGPFRAGSTVPKGACLCVYTYTWRATEWLV